MIRRTSLKRTGNLSRHTRIAPASARRRQKQRERREAVEAAFGRRPACAAQLDDCDGWASDAHEPGMRSRGADPTDPAQVIPVCRPCHDWIHANVKKATALGLLIPSWISDKSPHV